MTFAHDLQAWRKAMGFTRAQAAEALGLPPSTLNGYLAGRPPAFEATLRKLMALLAERP